MRFERDAFELNELADRWGVAGADIRYLVASNRMRLSVRIVAQPVVLHAREWTAEGEPFWVPIDETMFSGLGDLTLRDAYRLVRDGEGYVSHLFLPDDQMLRLHGEDGMRFSHVDLLVRRDCAESLEREVRGAPAKAPESFDFRLFTYGDREFAFTMPQARALEYMLMQTQAGAPEQHYTDILNAVGSASQRLSSLFSRKPDWSRLLRKTKGRRGWYHLDPQFVVWLLTRHRA